MPETPSTSTKPCGHKTAGSNPTPGWSTSPARIDLTLPRALQGLDGDFQYVAGNDERSLLGVAQMAEVAVGMLAALVGDRAGGRPLTVQRWEDTREMVDLVGLEGVQAFRVAAE
ncbi:hypothetical protein S40285_10524 [Stachybotrys chlorohalonatus IBT 40285]|uniref:Uncharacterized protein n=1 Tax=Stachybotrys chlorohalonatus (strain IBT 40285) TaxID=1283841 RepID=A0A084QZN8_STAC4|nr:hypothetical protein S40285_10524 [Stachybotrys chlorohalonata IBT 40285]